MSAASAQIVTRCFRQVCSCKDYWKINRCLPDTRKEYELCFKRAMLDGTINLIMQARKAIMSKDDEGVTITIEAGGWNDAAHIRPKYAITITRNLQ